MVVLHINGALVMFLLFCGHQDTESESCEMINGVAEPILTQKKTKVSKGQKYPCLTGWVKKMYHSLIFMELELFPLYIVITKTMNLSNEK